MLLHLHLLGAIVTSVWQLAICRMLAGVGIGGEWSMGGTFVAGRVVGSPQGRCGLHAQATTSASSSRRSRTTSSARPTAGASCSRLEVFRRCSSASSASAHMNRSGGEQGPGKASVDAQNRSGAVLGDHAKRTILNSLFLLVSVVGLWAGSVYVPTSMTQLSRAAGYTAPQSPRRWRPTERWCLSAGTIIGCLGIAPLAERFGRRMTLGFYFIIMFFSIAIGFGYVDLSRLDLALHDRAVLPRYWRRQLRYTRCGCRSSISTECRASAFAFATSVDRFRRRHHLPRWRGSRTHYGTLGTPVAFTSIAFLLGLFLLPMGEETTGKTLPA